MAIINAIPMAGRLGDYFNLDFPNATYDDNGYITAITASLTGSSFSTSFKSRLTEISFPKCSSIASSAFANATSLQSINLPQLTFLGSYAFSGCTSLSDIYLPQLQYLWAGAFKGCTSLTEINLPQGVQLMSSVFQSCSNLVSFTIKYFVGVGEHAFDGCTKLKDFTVNWISPDLQLRSYCFRSCYALSVFPFSACAFIEGSAFAHCSALTTVSLTSCSQISAYAFGYCTSLTTIYLMNSSVVSIPGSIVFYSAGIKPNAGSIYVPTSLVSAYKSATGWSYFKSIIYGV